jgi:hypothetical protein
MTLPIGFTTTWTLFRDLGEAAEDGVDPARGSGQGSRRAPR